MTIPTGYYYKKINIANGYNFENGNTTIPILASGNDTFPNFAGFPHYTTCPSISPSPVSVNSAGQLGGALGYEINNVDIANNCTAYSIPCTAANTSITVPTWATKIAFLVCGGGGGGGGGATVFDYDKCGGGGCGGGGGGICIGYVSKLNNIISLSVAMTTSGGGGGDGGFWTLENNGSPGSTGNTTTVNFLTSPTTIFGTVTANGGSGGGGGKVSGSRSSSSPSTSDGTGGSASVIGFNDVKTFTGQTVVGINGPASSDNPPTIYGSSGGAASFNNSSTANQNFPAITITSTVGVGSETAGIATASSIAVNGTPGGAGTGYGAGGGGGAGIYNTQNANLGTPGGAGAPGYAQIWFYI